MWLSYIFAEKLDVGQIIYSWFLLDFPDILFVYKIYEKANRSYLHLIKYKKKCVLKLFVNICKASSQGSRVLLKLFFISWKKPNSWT